MLIKRTRHESSPSLSVSIFRPQIVFIWAFHSKTSSWQSIISESVSGRNKANQSDKIKLSSKLQLIKAEAWENVKHINKSVTVKSAKNLLSEYTVKGKKQDVFAVSVFGFISRLFVGKKTLKCHWFFQKNINPCWWTDATAEVNSSCFYLLSFFSPFQWCYRLLIMPVLSLVLLNIYLIGFVHMTCCGIQLYRHVSI